MLRIFSTFTALAVAAVLSAPAKAQNSVQSGSLTCDVSAGIGFIIGSQRSVNCTFQPNAGAPEYYSGSISKLGIDIGVTGGAVMVWAVFAPTSRPIGALAGTYVGGTADASIIIGAGANALVGGSNRTVALQPLSVQGQVGINVAAGVAGLELRFVR